MQDSTHHHAIELTGNDLTVEQVLDIAEHRAPVTIAKDVKEKIASFRKGLELYLYEHPEKPIYGVTQGCGDLLSSPLKKKEWKQYKSACIDHKNDPQNKEKEACRQEMFERYVRALEDYQVRYIKAHNCGTGDPLSIEVVRAMMVIRLNSFAKGVSAVRLETCQHILDLLNRGVTPWVLEEGSVGASGDLVSLAMIAATMMGLEGSKAFYDVTLMDSQGALSRAELQPIRLAAKEAMALTNGTNFITALAVFALRDAETLLRHASIAAALAIEAIRGEPKAFSDFLISLRPHHGSEAVARQLRNLLEGSQRTTVEAQMICLDSQKINFEQPGQSPLEKPNQRTVRERIQDRYSFRAVPQVHGAAFEAVEKLREVVEIELNSATDNPLFNGTEAYSGANFHGQPLATVIDYVKIALTGLALITNKRIFSMLDRSQNFGLPQALAADGEGGDTGLMIAQYATAARVAESRILSTPASVMSISTSANQEDFVSMGSIGALHLCKIIHNLRVVIAIEVLCALRGLQMSQTADENLNDPEQLELLTKLGNGTNKIYEHLNRVLPPPEQDRYLRTDIDTVIGLVKAGELISLVKEIL
jgi:histidine ammonia-lyase